jgi:hypothetical protein
MSEPAPPAPRPFKPWVLGAVIGLSMVLGTAVGNNVVEARWAQILVGAAAAGGFGLVFILIALAIQKRRAKP